MFCPTPKSKASRDHSTLTTTIRRKEMSRHLLRTAMVVGIAALALSVAAPVRAADEAAPPKPKRHQFTGIVESIDAKAGTAIVKKDTESKTFKIGEKTKYSTVDKKEAAVGDI